mmetsp:Transcript_69817/g.134702  ORF Transcript_69817/g.134702 Transcript_69817/m.134702 type:complete len:110 (-) Transcript_69817:389-718(-)
MRTLLNSWAFALCLFSVFRGSASECATAGSEDEACEKMLLVRQKLLDEQSNAFLEEESEEGLEETEQASDKGPKKKKKIFAEWLETQVHVKAHNKVEESFESKAGVDYL